MIDQIREYYGEKVLKTEIRVNVRLKEAPSFGKHIFDYDSGSTGQKLIENCQTKDIERSKMLRKGRDDG